MRSAVKQALRSATLRIRELGQLVHELNELNERLVATLRADPARRQEAMRADLVALAGELEHAPDEGRAQGLVLDLLAKHWPGLHDTADSIDARASTEPPAGDPPRGGAPAPAGDESPDTIEGAEVAQLRKAGS